MNSYDIDLPSGHNDKDFQRFAANGSTADRGHAGGNLVVVRDLLVCWIFRGNSRWNEAVRLRAELAEVVISLDVNRVSDTIDSIIGIDPSLGTALAGLRGPVHVHPDFKVLSADPQPAVAEETE